MARVVIPSYPHHVTQRGNRRQTTFFDNSDYRDYIELVSKFCRKSSTKVWAYCLMPNHVHLIMVPSHKDGLRASLGEAHRRYTRKVNSRNEWRGHLWQERFFSFPMDEAHLLAAVRYVERNPVAAQLCQHPEDWQWSSARAHLLGRGDGLVDVRPMLSRINDWATYLSSDEDDGIRDRIATSTRTGRPLGAESFVQTLEKITGRELAPRRPGRKKKPGAK
jgi:putative transposase